MVVIFFGNYLNHHQVLLADELHKILKENFHYIATLPRNEKELKGGRDYSNKPYCILAGESETAHRQAVMYAESADVCVFGACSQEYAVIRAKRNPQGLSFEVGERWLKKGWLNVLSPHLMKWWTNYMKYFRKANFYKLCSSSFGSYDDERLGCYRKKHYKWGYFTAVPDCAQEEWFNVNRPIRLMWCARFIKLKHPEIAIKMARKLKSNGYSLLLDFYGSGVEEDHSRILVDKWRLNDCINFQGNKSNDEILEAMCRHDVLIFTSNRLEGWGAVVNEAMAHGCAVVSADCIGSTGYLVEDGVTGLKFKAGSVSSLADKVEYLISNPEILNKMKHSAYELIYNLWSPHKAAINLLQLIDDIQAGRETSITEGPCSKA